MSDAGQKAGPSVQLPGIDDDATPFMLRCYVKAYPFRPLQDFELGSRQDEFKLYVWRSATLRDIANMLHMRDPSLSTAFSSHSFRIVRQDSRRRTYTAREAATGVTRISRVVFEDILSDVISHTDSPEVEKDIIETMESSATFDKVVSRVRPRLPDEADEEKAKLTLDELDFNEGDILDCVIKGSPALTAGVSIKRSRIDSVDSHSYSRDRDRDRNWTRNQYSERGMVNDRRQRYR